MRGELTKLRRTFVPATLLAWPATVALLVWAVLAQGGRERTWTDVVEQGALMWGGLLLPLLVALLAAQLVAFEHAPGAWRWWSTLPRGRWRLVAPKIGVLLGSALASSLLAAVVLVPVGLALDAGPGVPWGELLVGFVVEWACALGIQLVLLTLAFRFESFLVPTGVGGLATVVAVFVMQSDRFGPWWPWALPIVSAVRPELWPQLLGFSVAVAGLASLVLFLDFARRDL